MGSLGGGEILLILLLGLLMFGPRKLPEIGRTVGKAVAEFRNATRQLRQGIEREVQLEELKEAKAGIDEVAQEAKEGLKVARGSIQLAPLADIVETCPETTDEERERVRAAVRTAEEEKERIGTDDGRDRPEPDTERST